MTSENPASVNHPPKGLDDVQILSGFLPDHHSCSSQHDETPVAVLRIGCPGRIRTHTALAQNEVTYQLVYRALG